MSAKKPRKVKERQRRERREWEAVIKDGTSGTTSGDEEQGSEQG